MFTAKDCHDCISPPAEQKPVTQQLLTGAERNDEKIAPCWLPNIIFFYFVFFPVTWFHILRGEIAE